MNKEVRIQKIQEIIVSDEKREDLLTQEIMWEKICAPTKYITYLYHI